MQILPRERRQRRRWRWESVDDVVRGGGRGRPLREKREPEEKEAEAEAERRKDEIRGRRPKKVGPSGCLKLEDERGREEKRDRERESYEVLWERGRMIFERWGVDGREGQLS